jgi:hypothetical protein
MLPQAPKHDSEMVILAKVVDLLKLPYQLAGLAWFFFL